MCATRGWVAFSFPFPFRSFRTRLERYSTRTLVIETFKRVNGRKEKGGKETERKKTRNEPDRENVRDRKKKRMR